ncbi:MAG TPA: Jag N-terminal domain-containing protein, partial [Candidatus Acidoferrales bacterium]|nr:Jag N-terminal domain-containing protein [Candidatus Acidoferrales bacterium]
MEFVETEGDTIDQAIANALKQLGVERDKITVEILAEGKRGIFGFGAQKARIRAAIRAVRDALYNQEPKPESAVPRITAAELAALAEKTKSILTDILDLMGIKASVEAKTGTSGDEVILEIHAENSGLLIGRKGQTLEAFQYLVTRIAGERPGSEGPHVVVDIEHYLERRRKTLEDMALRLG